MRELNVKIKKMLPMYIILIILLSLLFSLFRRGRFLASQESALWLYNINNFIAVSKFTWREIATGEFTNTGITAYPYLIILKLLYSLLKEPVYVQLAFFGIYMFIGVFFMYKLMFYLLNEIKIDKNTKILSSCIVAFFYVFNLHTLICVFNRFQYPFMIFWGFIPLTFYHFLKWINVGNIKHLVISNVVFIIFLSFSYISPAFIVNTIILYGLYIFLLLFIKLSKKQLSITLIKRCFIFVIINSLLNSWWVLPMIYTAIYTKNTSLFNLEYNLELLNIGSSWIRSLMNSIRLFYYSYFHNIYWGKIYFTNVFTFLTFLPACFSSLGIVFVNKIKGKKDNILVFYILLLIFIFLSKGINPPFGIVFEWIFKHLPIFQTYRLPFEKIGFLLSFVYSITLGYSVSTLLVAVDAEKLCGYLLILDITLVILVLAWPIFSGSVLSRNIGNEIIWYDIEVPKDYSQLDMLLSMDRTDCRVIGLPIKHYGSQAIYYWDNSKYFGYCPLQILISKPVISFILYSTIFPYTDPLIQNTEKILIDQENIKPLELLSVKYIVIQDDLDEKATIYSKTVVENKILSLKENNIVNCIFCSNYLKAYKISNSYYMPHIYALDKYTLTRDESTLFDLFKEEYYDPRETIIFTAKDLGKEKINFLINLHMFKKYNIIRKPRSLSIDLSGFKLENIPRECEEKIHYENGTLIWYVKINNDKKWDKYSIVKIFDKPLDLSSFDYFILEIYSTSPLIEINFVEDLNGTGGGSGKYAWKILQLAPYRWNRIVIFKDELKYVGGEINWEKIRRLRFYVTDDKKWGGIGVKEENMYVIRSLTAYELPNLLIPVNTFEIDIPLYDFHLDSDPFNSSMLCYNEDADELVWEIRIPNKAFGDTAMFTISKLFEADLSGLDKVELEVFSNTKYLEVNFVRDLYGKGGGDGEYAWYKFRLEPNKWNKIVIPKEAFYYINFNEDEWRDIHKVRFYIAYPNWGVKGGDIVFKIRKFKIFLTNYDEFHIILRDDPPHRPILTFKRVNPTKYIVTVKNATRPFFLVFSESYHPLWKVYTMNKLIELSDIIAEYPIVSVREARHDWYKFTPEDIIFLFKKPAVNETLHFMANGYANAWYIDPRVFDGDGDGCFTIIIYFWPQSLFYLGLFVSGATLLCCIGYLVYDWYRSGGSRRSRYLLRFFRRIVVYVEALLAKFS